MNKLLIFAFVIAFVIGASEAFAYVVPQDDSNAEFFYVTGPKGNPLLGAEDHEQTLHIDIPADEEDALRIAVFDPDTGGAIDSKDDSKDWDTFTEITVSGKRGVIYRKEFGEGNYDNEFYYFDPILKAEGEKAGNCYRFTLTLKAKKGDDSNLFKVEVLPDSAKVSSQNITFRLLEEEGAQMHFYPLLPEGTSRIVVENYDLDEDGGTSYMHDASDSEHYDIEGSLSGQWSGTELNLTSIKERYLDYVITKGKQKHAHAGLRIKDADGNLLPIYFRKRNMGGCNEFTFDATKSFDPDDQALTYRWDFGDGTVSDQPIVTHRFESGGDYNVTLSVQDTSGLDCDTAVSSRVIHVNEPPVAIFTGPQTACTGQVVTFDASGTTDDTREQITYHWDFRDGTSAEGQQVTKVFDKGGTYNVLLTVNDNSGTTCSTDSVEEVIIINTPPVAHAGSDVNLCLEHNQEYRVNFDAAGSTDADGDILTYKWDFGDGTGATGKNVTHLYQNSGEYVATLVIEDGSGASCNTSSDTVNVRLNKAPVAVAGDDIMVCQGAEVVFDGSGSIGEEGEDLQYTWDFGDGTTGNGVSVAHVYEKGGHYEVVLTVNDMQNTKCSVSSDRVLVTVNTRPSAVFSSANIACTGDVIPFNASETIDYDGDILTYTWDFGDGTKEQGRSSMSHIYQKGGNYAVKLTVDDNKGTECSRDMAGINVRINTPPVADAGPNLVCCLDTVSEFDGSLSFDPDGDSLTYVWNFGDGATGQGAKVTHVYSDIGKYIVTLTVNDNSGAECDSATDSFTAVVNAKPTSIIEVR